MSVAPEAEAEIGKDGLTARIRLGEGQIYRLDGGRVTCGLVGGKNMSGGNPGVTINGSIGNPDASEIHPGDEVVVRLTYGDRTAEFPAKGTKSTASNPAAFKAVRGKQPVGNFEEYEKVKRMLKRVESDSE